MFENIVTAWKENTLQLEDYGLNIHPDSPIAKEDFVAGEPESFQVTYFICHWNEINDLIREWLDCFIFILDAWAPTCDLRAKRT